MLFFEIPIRYDGARVPIRNQPIDFDRECRVGQRLRHARQLMRYSQAEFAAKIDLSRDQLSNIESGRTPLKYSLAWRIREAHGISLDYFTGNSSLGVPDRLKWPVPETSRGARSALFTQVADKVDASHEPLIAYNSADTPAGSSSLDLWRRIELGKMLHGEIDDALASLPPEHVAPFINSAWAAVGELRRSYPRLSAAESDKLADVMAGVALRSYSEGRNPRLESGEPKGESNVNQCLTSSGTSDHPPDMPTECTAHWERLRKRIRGATKARGAMANLARRLGVTRQAVSQWLQGVSVPEAETALHLAVLFPPEEAKQHKGPSGADDTTGATKTRKSKTL